MKTNDFLYLALLHRTLDYEKDPDPENWRTIKGAHVHVDNEGKIDGGAGGKFNGKGVLPRSLFPGQGKAKQTEFAEVTAKRKEAAEAARKALEAAKVQHKKELAEARKAKLEKQRELETKRPELKQKFNDLRESYHKETDAKKKKAIIKQLKEIENEYKDKFGKHPDDDNIKLPEKKPEAKKETKNYYGIPYGSNGVSEQLAYELHSRRKPNSSFEEETAFSVQDLIKELNNGSSLEEAVKKVDKQWQPYYPESRTPIYYFMKSFNERNGKKEAAKEPKTSTNKTAGNKDVRVKLKNGVTLRWQEVPGEPDKVYNPETREMYEFKGGLKAAIEKAESQGATVEEYEKPKSNPYENESASQQQRGLARAAQATRRAAKRGRPLGAR